MNYSHLIGCIVAIVGSGVPYVCAEPFDLAHQVGLAIVDNNGAVCLMIDNKHLEPSRSLTVFRVEAEPILHSAIVSKMLASPCPMALKADVAGECYELQILTGGKLKPGSYFALLGPQSQFGIKSKEILATLEGLPDPVLFRVCTSNEGIHLTLWQGKPITGKRLWHRYFYLGYDVEPSCQPAETN